MECCRRFSVANSTHAKASQETKLQTQVDWLTLTADRMMPNQDEMPIGGMGNLIALPLQEIQRKSGNSVFVDDDWNVIPNQWEYLEQRKLLSKKICDEQIVGVGNTKRVAYFGIRR